MPMRTAFRMFLVLIIGLLAAACSSEEPGPPTRVPTLPPPTNTPVPPTATPSPEPSPTSVQIAMPEQRAASVAEQSYLRVLHAIPDAPPVDVFVEALGMAFDLDYGRATQATAITGGNYTVRVMPEGIAPDEGDPLTATQVNVPTGRTSFLVITGTPDAPQVTLHLMFEDPLARNMARVSLIHAVNDGPEVTIQRNGTNLTTPIGYNQQSVPVDQPAAPTTLTLAGNGQTLANFITTLEARTHYTLVLTGNANAPDSLQLLEFSNRVPGLARVRAINLTRDRDGVDVYLDGEPLATSMAFAESTERQQTGTGQHTLEVLPATGDYASSMPLGSTQFNLNSGNDLSFIVMGTGDDIDIVQHRENLSPTAPEEARVTFIHALPGAGRAQVALGDDTGGDPVLQYGQVTGPRPIRARSLNLSWVEVETQRNLEESGNITFEPGMSYLYMMIGQDYAEGPFILSESVGVDDVLAADAEPTPIPEEPARLRVVNMLQDRSQVGIYIDGGAFVRSLAHQQISGETLLQSGTHTISVRPPATGTPPPERTEEPGGAAVSADDLLAFGYEFVQNGRYTLYVYGENTGSIETLMLRNPGFETQGVYLRMINLTIRQDDTPFGLALAEPSDSPEPTINPTSAADLPPDRRPIFGASRTIINDLPQGEASEVRNVQPGTYDIIIIDDRRGLLASKQFDVELPSGGQYDIVVSQLPDSLAVNYFLIPYQ